MEYFQDICHLHTNYFSTVVLLITSVNSKLLAISNILRASIIQLCANKSYSFRKSTEATHALVNRHVQFLIKYLSINKRSFIPFVSFAIVSFLFKWKTAYPFLRQTDVFLNEEDVRNFQRQFRCEISYQR